MAFRRFTAVGSDALLLEEGAMLDRYLAGKNDMDSLRPLPTT